MSVKPITSSKSTKAHNQQNKSHITPKTTASNFENLIQKTILQRPSGGISIESELNELTQLESDLQENPNSASYNRYQNKIRKIVKELLPKAYQVKSLKNPRNNSIYEVEKIINQELAVVYKSLLTLHKDTKAALESMNAIKGLIVNELR